MYDFPNNGDVSELTFSTVGIMGNIRLFDYAFSNIPIIIRELSESVVLEGVEVDVVLTDSLVFKNL